MRRFYQSVDLRSRSQMTDFLTKHFRYAGATHISVLMELLAKQLDSRFPRRDCRGKDYSVFKVQKVIGMLS